MGSATTKFLNIDKHQINIVTTDINGLDSIITNFNGMVCEWCKIVYIFETLDGKFEYLIKINQSVSIYNDFNSKKHHDKSLVINSDGSTHLLFEDEKIKTPITVMPYVENDKDVYSVGDCMVIKFDPDILFNFIESSDFNKELTKNFLSEYNSDNVEMMFDDSEDMINAEQKQNLILLRIMDIISFNIEKFGIDISSHTDSHHFSNDLFDKYYCNSKNSYKQVFMIRQQSV